VIARPAIALMLLCASAQAAAPLSFDEIITMARRQNPAAAATRAQIDRAEALMRQVRAASLPTLTANAGYTRLDNDRVLGDRVLQSKDTFSANLNATVPLLAPARWGAWRRASDLYKATRKQEGATDRDIAVTAARAFFAVVLQRRSLSVAEHARDIATSRVRFAEQRLGGGVGSKVDLVRAQQDLEAAETQLINFRLAAARALEALTVALGLDAPPDISAELPSRFHAAAPAAGDAVLHRPDVQAQDALVAAARRGTRDVWLDYLPNLTLVFQPFYQNPATPTVPEFGWQALFTLSLPLYDGGLRYGLQRERRAVLLQARSQYDALLLQARSDLRISEVALTEARRSLERATSSAKLAREAAELARVGYEAGAFTNFELLDADRRARDAELQLANAEDDLRQSELDSLAATGQFP
jgi:outer membrane protein